MKWRILRQGQDQQTGRGHEKAGHCDKNYRAAIGATEGIGAIRHGPDPKTQRRQQPGNEKATNH